MSVKANALTEDISIPTCLMENDNTSTTPISIDFVRRSVKSSRICTMASAPMRHPSSPSTPYLKPIWKPRPHWRNPPFRTICICGSIMFRMNLLQTSQSPAFEKATSNSFISISWRMVFHTLSELEFNEMMAEGLAQAKANQGVDLDDAFNRLEIWT